MISPGTFFGKKKKTEELERDEETDRRIQEIRGEERKRKEAIAKGISIESYVKEQKQKAELEFEEDILEILDEN